jgi:hypothetical protein
MQIPLQNTRNKRLNSSWLTRPSKVFQAHGISFTQEQRSHYEAFSDFGPYNNVLQPTALHAHRSR